MKNYFLKSIVFSLISVFALAQSNTAKTTINSNLVNQGVRGITDAKLVTTLNGIVDWVGSPATKRLSTTQVRALTSDYPNLIFLTDGTTGLFAIDNADNSTVDNGVDVLVTTSAGKRYKRVTGQISNVDGLQPSLNSKLETPSSISSLQNYNASTYAFLDGSTWNKKAGDKTSNGGTAPGTIIRVSSSFYWERIVDQNYFPEWFGAKGDGTTDDTQAIQNAIDYVATLPKGGNIQFRAKTYLATHIYLRKAVSLYGAEKFSSNTSANNVSATIIKCKNTSFQESFIELYPDNSFPSQAGEITGALKSHPQFSIKNITFDGNYQSKYTFTIKEAWTFLLENNYFVGGYAYSLNLTDCNEFDLNKNIIRGFLNISNADYTIEGNDVAGSSQFPAFMSYMTGLGNTTNNKIYLGGNSTPINKFDVTDINSGVFKFKNFNLLTETPGWVLAGTPGTVTYTEENKTLKLLTTNGASIISVTTLPPILVPGVTYKLTGTYKVSGVSATKNLSMRCGDATQTYGSVVANSSTQNLNISFVFNPPSGNNATNPLKIVVNANTVTGVDTLIFTNLKITTSASNPLDGVPMVFNYPNSASSTLKTNFPHSEVFFPKFTSDTTFVLYQTLSTYAASSGYVTATAASLSGYSVEIPNCTAFFGGRTGYGGIFSNNKLEDFKGDGVILRGVYNNVFSNNKISKGIGSDYTKLWSVTKGATKNIISGNLISARVNASPDLAYIGVYVDEYSGENTFTGNLVSNNSYMDIVDEYNGNELSQNQYDANTLKEAFVYIKKPIDYTYYGKSLKINKGKTAGVTNQNMLITNPTEFSLFFKNVKFENGTGDSYLFQQIDVSNGSDAGRFLVKITSAGQILTMIGSTTVLNSAFASQMTSGKYYDICIVKDAGNKWSLYIDGLLMISETGISTPITTTAGVKSYIGSGLFSQNADLYLSGFQYFNDALSSAEVKNISFNSHFNINQPSTALLNGRSSGTSTFSGITNGSVSIQGGSGVDGGDGLKLTTLNNNLYPLNLSSSITKNNILRISYYVKSATLSSSNNTRQNISKYGVLTNSFTKVVKYIYPDQTTSGSEAVKLSFGTLTDDTFFRLFTAKAGDVYLDYLKVYANSYPVTTILDFSEDTNNGFYKNKLDTTRFINVDGAGGWLLRRDVANNTYNIKRNISFTNNTGTDVMTFASGGITANTFLYVPNGLWTLSGSALQLGTLGANSIQFFQNGSEISRFSSGSLGIGTTSVNASAILDLSSTSKGLLLPRLTTSQVNAISSPAAGLTVFNITLNTIVFYNGTTWKKVVEADM